MPKKEFTSFDVASVVNELGNSVSGSRVSNVYQIGTRLLLLKLHKVGYPPINLVLETGRRLHTTSYELAKPSTPPAFCMAMRKYLRDAQLVSVKQHEFERVVVFIFQTKDGGIKLVVELFGDGNFILISEKGVILQALEYKRMRDRNILRGETFAFAPPLGRNPFNVNREELSQNLKSFNDVEVVRAIARFLGLGGVYAEEVLLRASVDKMKKCSAVDEVEVNRLFDALQGLLGEVKSSKLEPSIILDELGTFLDVVPLRLKRHEGLRRQSYASFNEALDEFYARLVTVEKATKGLEIDALEREAERLRRIVKSQETTLADAEPKAEQERQIGDTIYAHSAEIQMLLNRLQVAKDAGKDWDDMVSEILNEKIGENPSLLLESFDRKGQAFTVRVDGLSFSLALKRNLYENASDYYERSKRAKQKLKGAKAALKDSRKKLTEVEAKIKEAETLQIVKPAEALEELAKSKTQRKEWFEKFRWFISSDGFLVVAGKDAVSNEVLIKKHTEAWDVVFHSEIVGAPFVVVKTESKEPTEQVLREAAEFAAAFSRGWREGFGTVDVYWVKPEQLSKKGPSGEYVAHGAFVVNGKRNWLRNTPLKTAIGVTSTENGEVSFAGGPVDTVKGKTDAYLILMPGDLSGKDLLKRILTILASKLPKETREKAARASIETIREFVPYGMGRILKDQ